MPLPKMPTRPAAILSFPSGEPARPVARGKQSEVEQPPPSSAELHEVQPQLAGIQAAPAKTARKTAKSKSGTLLTPAAKAPEAPVARAPQPASAKAQAPAKTTARPATGKRKAKSAGPEVAKLFVLDTNVLMHDPSSLFRFEEHDIFLPMMTLEELDNHKKGMSEVARNARQVSRSLDELVSDIGDMDAGIPLDKLGNRDALGRLYLQTTLLTASLPSGLPAGKADNQILGVVRALQERFPEREVVLVSKDINMRVKARALGLPAEDYFNDQVLEDSDLLYTGVLPLPDDFWDKHSKGMESWNRAAAPSTASPAPCARNSRSTSSCTSKAACRCTRRSRRSWARPPCCRRCASTPTARTTSGA